MNSPSIMSTTRLPGDTTTEADGPSHHATHLVLVGPGGDELLNTRLQLRSQRFLGSTLVVAEAQCVAHHEAYDGGGPDEPEHR